MTIVVDASVLVAALVDSGRDGRWAETVVAGDDAAGPEPVLVEVANVPRRLERTGEVSRLEAASAYGAPLRLNMRSFPFASFAERGWALRSDLTGRDARYVAPAENLGRSLATLDGKLARANGPGCGIVVRPWSGAEGTHEGAVSMAATPKAGFLRARAPRSGCPDAWIGAG